MSLEDQYELPDDFNLKRADPMERVETECGTTLCVLESATTGERRLVHNDIIEFKSTFDHPALDGFGGLFGVLVALVTPTVAALAIIEQTLAEPGLAALATAVVVGGAVGSYTSNYVLWNTRFGAAIDRFQEWYEVKEITMSRGESA